MSPPPIQVSRTPAERKRAALVATGVAPRQFGRRKPARPHRDRKLEAALALSAPARHRA
jgi:hypothetical protein